MESSLLAIETTTKPAISQLSGGSFLLPDAQEIRKECQNG
jgi:hypothetical protein